MRTLKRWMVVLVWMVGLVMIPASAQDGDPVVVPDLTGLNVPQAAAALNRVGLAVGRENPVAVTEGVTPNLISGQSVAPGQTAPAGSAIGVDIPRNANVRLFYDDNDITMMNLRNQNIPLGEVIFEVVEGTQAASFEALAWADQLRGRRCAQLWSVSRGEPKDVQGCRSIQRWQTTNNPARHFWTTSSGARTFRVMQGETERALCQAATPSAANSPLSCEFYLPSVGGGNDVTAYIYFAYNDDKLAVFNNSADQWMPVNTTPIANALADPAPFGREFRLNRALFGRPDIVANINRLAPGQCLLFINSAAPDAEPPQACDVIATYTVEPSQRWWTANFEVLTTDNRRRTCNAATPDKLTLCIMAR